MAKVASSGAEDALATIEGQPRRSFKKSEAFVMSGDVLISLNRNVSSTYAKLLGDQLPPTTAITSNTPPQQLTRTCASAGVAFPSMNRGSKKVSRLPVSTSQPDGVRRVQPRSSESPTAIRMHKAAPIEKPESLELDESEIIAGSFDIMSRCTEYEGKENDEIDGRTQQLLADEKLIVDSEEIKSPNEEIVNKSLRSAMFSMPSSSTPSYSSPQINEVESLKNSSMNGGMDSSPIYDDVNESDTSKRIDSNVSTSELYHTAINRESNMNDTPSKRSVVTIDANHSSYQADESLMVELFTTCETPHRSATPQKNQSFKNQYKPGTSSSTSASPSLHGVSEKRDGSIRCDSNPVFSTQPTTSNHTMTSVSGEREATILARKLYELRGCSAKDVADRLNEQNEFSFLVLVKYLELFQFSTTRIDAALREFLSRVELRGESSQRERLLRVFSARYLDCNPSIFESLDEVHTLTCALLLLNSDLHGPNNGRKMTARDFITNIGHTGCTYKRDMLKTLYQSIKDNAIALQHPTPKNSTANGSVSSIRKQQCIYEVDPNAVVEYHSGYLMRKHVREADGAKTPFGRRSWKMVYARLRGLVLYFDSDEHPRATSRYASLENAVSLHHAFAEPSLDYKKKTHVFRIRIAHGGEILFQTSNENELEQWCVKINFVSAAFSSPTLPLPVTSKPESAPMPRLPRVPCLSPIYKQIRNHESRIAELNAMIERVAQSVYPERPEQQITDRLVLLYFEKRRYTSYVNILRKHMADRKLSCGTVNAIVSPRRTHNSTKGSTTICEDRLSYTDAVNGCK